MNNYLPASLLELERAVFRGSEPGDPEHEVGVAGRVEQIKAAMTADPGERPAEETP